MAENDWLIHFDITQDDLMRLYEWLSEQKHGVTLEELTFRIIRGRLRFGRDNSPSALREWGQENHVLSWDEEEKWCVGCQVLVARRLNGKIVPCFGVINAISNRYFDIQINDKVVIYNRAIPGSAESKNYYESIRKSISQQPENISTDEQINNVILKNGAKIATRINGALNSDPRFVTNKFRWYLQQWIPEISYKEIEKAHRQIWRTTKQATLPQVGELITGLSKGDFGEIALVQALSKVPDLFQPSEGGWQAVKPPPPPWEKAVGGFYVYDPKTYEIILKPGEKLRKKTAERLLELGFYADVVAEAES